MKKFLLTDKRKDKLADYCLNLSVASFAVAAYENKWWGVVPGAIGFIGFFLLTKEK